MTPVRRCHLAPRLNQRGVAALVVTLILCVTMVLAVAFAQRAIGVEERRSANDYRTAQAFEAAEAGLEWALARVNDPTRLDDDCRPSADPTARSWRERMLHVATSTSVVEATTWSDAGVATTLQSACVRDAAGWTCSCPSNARPALPLAGPGATAPAFAIELGAGPRPGLVRVRATGCIRSAAGRACTATAMVDNDASASHESMWSWVPALRTPPVAALTVRGDVVAGIAALGVHNPDRAGGGLALQAGGRVQADSLRLSAPNGSSLATAVVTGDTELAALTGDRFFARHFGMGRDAWSRQTSVARVACADDCAQAIAATVAAGYRLVYVDGDLALAGPLQIGSNVAPVMLVAAGDVRVGADVAIRGVLRGASLTWNGAGAGPALVQGAALVEGDYRGDGTPDFVHDAALLALLRAREGSFVRINGSWKDF
jgi:type II secretory pathway pseudopilin PulG